MAFHKSHLHFTFFYWAKENRNVWVQIIKSCPAPRVRDQRVITEGSCKAVQDLWENCFMDHELHVKLLM